jgi:Holliday junction resolvase-like predicted endonuclease
MGRFFNTAGPCQPEDHYTIDPMSRLSSVQGLVENKRYFILHAPRQTGKTTTMISFVQAMNKEGKYAAVYANVETAQAVRSDLAMANNAFVNAVAENARFFLPKEYWPSKDTLDIEPGAEKFKIFLQRWSLELPKPLVLFIDEADALIGDVLLSLLRQLRSGYALRPNGFPHSIALIGLRDIRDYRIFSEKEQRFVIGGSAFNIKETSLVMGNFSKDEVVELYAQHTAETGQQFAPDAIDLVFEQTQGQPWLVNALGKEMCFEDFKVNDKAIIILDDVKRAVETLILRRDTHLDHLGDKLSEPRVARVIGRILAGDEAFSPPDETYDDDVSYLKDLGLVKKTPQGLAIANPIYREVIPRHLTDSQQIMWASKPEWYIGADGRLKIEAVLERFFEFYRENGELITKRKTYTESAHHLTFMAWLQRIVNGGGYIRREYAAGLGFIDLVVEFGPDKFVFELKTEKNYKQAEALAQIAEYAQRMSVKECYLVVFRRKMTKPEKVGERSVIEHDGLKVHLIWV